jgi:hypothetical protein
MELSECAENARQPNDTVRRALPCGHKVGGYTARPSVYVHPRSLFLYFNRRRLYRPTNRVPSRALVKQRRLVPALSQHRSARSAAEKYHTANRNAHYFDICDHNRDRVEPADSGRALDCAANEPVAGARMTLDCSRYKLIGLEDTTERIAIAAHGVRSPPRSTKLASFMNFS